MAKTILSKNQKRILQIISKNETMRKNFYLSGGTALAEFYLHHRFSKDLDFFSENEFDPQVITVFLKQNQRELGTKKVAYEQSFNRNIFLLYINKDIVKIEFTYFPFLRIDKTEQRNKLFIDSLLDIAVNKIFTIYQKPRARDFIDLYFIIKKTGWTITNLIKKAKIKFDWHIDPIQFGSQLVKATYLKDYPIMIKKINNKAWQDFFIKIAKDMSKDILK